MLSGIEGLAISDRLSVQNQTESSEGDLMQEPKRCLFVASLASFESQAKSSTSQAFLEDGMDRSRSFLGLMTCVVRYRVIPCFSGHSE